MGLNKRQHITQILKTPHVSAAWEAKYGRAWTESDVDSLYHAFTPIQVAVARQRAEPIPGAVEAFAELRKQGINIGSCSGYNEAIMEAVVEAVAKHGLVTDAMVW